MMETSRTICQLQAWHNTASLGAEASITSLQKFTLELSEGDKHWQMKELLAKTLINLPNWEVVDVDTQFVFSLDKLKRAKPDLHARYLGTDVAFEIQLRSESPKVILDRQHFYQEKEWPLIWLSAENEDQILDFLIKKELR